MAPEKEKKHLLLAQQPMAMLVRANNLFFSPSIQWWPRLETPPPAKNSKESHEKATETKRSCAFGNGITR